MARSLRGGIVITLFVAAFAAYLSIEAKPAIAAEMDRNAKADAKTAMRFYKEGNYEDAAKIFLKLSIAHPDMLVFVRNLGACYYYMRRYEPALSNLRDYEHRKKDMAPDDRAEVEGWIGEMERLRDQAAVTAVAPVAPPAAVPSASVAAAAAPPAVASLPAAAPAMPPALAGVPALGSVAPEAAPDTSGPAAISPQAAVTPSPSPAAPASPASENVYPQQQSMGGQPTYGQGQSSAPPAYPQGQYSAPPAYGQGPYVAQPVSPNTQYAPVGGGYPPTYQPAAYPPGGPPAGIAAPASQPKSSGGARKAVAWILGIAGIGSAGAGGYYAYKAVSDFSKVEKKYDPGLESEGKTDRKAAWILCGAGAAALTVAIIVGASGSSSSPAVALAPVVGPGAAGASLSGSF